MRVSGDNRSEKEHVDGRLAGHMQPMQSVDEAIPFEHGVMSLGYGETHRLGL
jgi:hypothetical protein